MLSAKQFIISNWTVCLINNIIYEYVNSICCHFIHSFTLAKSLNSQPAFVLGLRVTAKRETDEASVLEFTRSSLIVTRRGANPILSLASLIYPYPTDVFLTELKQTSAGILVISIILNCRIAYQGSFNMSQTKRNEPQKSQFASQ